MLGGESSALIGVGLSNATLSACKTTFIRHLSVSRSSIKRRFSCVVFLGIFRLAWVGLHQVECRLTAKRRHEVLFVDSCG